MIQWLLVYSQLCSHNFLKDIVLIYCPLIIYDFRIGILFFFRILPSRWNNSSHERILDVNSDWVKYWELRIME